MSWNQCTQRGKVGSIDHDFCSNVFGHYQAFNGMQYLAGKRQFAAMEHAFRRHGGFADTDEIASRLRCCCETPVSRLTEWIVSRSVVCISWDERSLMPAFQFEQDDMSVRPCCAAIFEVLGDVLDSWHLGLWFAAPHPHLDFAAPVAILANEGAAVMQAARDDRLLSGY